MMNVERQVADIAFEQVITVGENIIATIKMRNKYCYHLNPIASHLVIAFPTLR